MIIKEINRIHEILLAEYASLQGLIEERLDDFKRVWNTGNDETIFKELVFCLLTPQSKARNCGRAVELLCQKNLIMNGTLKELQEILKIVRFHNNKSSYIISARSQLFSGRGLSLKKILQSFPDVYDKREWLVKNVKGLGYKEASHFLRNIGFGHTIAILDRHILKNMKALEIIDEIPASISAKSYYALEKKLDAYAKKTKIPISHLDLLLWYRETGEIYK